MSLIPDTLIIFITTKIPSYTNFIYNSKNTIPNTNSSILMNPLILLKSDIVNPNLLFDKTMFETLLREDKLTKLPTLIQATKSDYINKNIKKILSILFAKEKKFYLGDYPFTIHTMSWNNNWVIQHKFTTPLTNIKEYLLKNEAKSIQENNLLNSLPKEVRTNNDKDYYLQYLTNLYLIKGSISEPITNKELLINDNDLGINNILKSIQLNKLPINLQFIINNYRSDYLIYISGIYYNLTTDPLILILFYTDKTYYDTPENYINIPKYIQQNTYLEELFNIFKEKRILLNTSNYNFWNIWKNLSYQQKIVEDLYKKLSEIFVKTPRLNYSNVESIMNNIEISQKEFFKLFVIYFQSFLNNLYAQKTYYKSTLLFLNELNNVYSGNLLNTQLNIENEQLIIQKDIKVFECIVKRFKKDYKPPLMNKVKKINIIKYYKNLYEKYIKIIFNLMKIKSYNLFNKIKYDKDLINFYIFQNYKLNLMVLSNYEYLKTYINNCLEDYVSLLNNNSRSSIITESFPDDNYTTPLPKPQKPPTSLPVVPPTPPTPPIPPPKPPKPVPPPIIDDSDNDSDLSIYDYFDSDEEEDDEDEIFAPDKDNKKGKPIKPVDYTFYPPPKPGRLPGNLGRTVDSIPFIHEVSSVADDMVKGTQNFVKGTQRFVEGATGLIKNAADYAITPVSTVLQNGVVSGVKLLDPASYRGGNPFTQISNITNTFVDSIKNRIQSITEHSVLDNYIISLKKNKELYDLLISLTPVGDTIMDYSIPIINNIKNKSKLLIEHDKLTYYQFITNSILTYSIVILIIYLILIILFQYLNYNGCCLNYYIIQKEYSTFDYLYTDLFYKKYQQDSNFSIPFSIPFSSYNIIENQQMIDGNYIKRLNIINFQIIIYCNSLICENSIVYNRINTELNKLLSNITPELNENIIINYLNYSSKDLNLNELNFYDLIDNNYNNFLSNYYDFDKFDNLNEDEYKETIKFQKYLLDIVDSGIYLKLLPKKEYISTNNWWLKNINITNDNDLTFSRVIFIYQELFKQMYDTEPDDSPYLMLNYFFIMNEIITFGNFNYIEMLANDNLRKKLFDFCKMYILFEELTEFNFYTINNIYKKEISNDIKKVIYVINNLYNNLFPNYFLENEIIFIELYKVIEINNYGILTEEDFNKIYNIFTKVENLEQLENNLTEIYLKIEYNDGNPNQSNKLLNQISKLNIYCNDKLLKYLLIILIYFIKIFFNNIKSKPSLKLLEPVLEKNTIYYFFYKNLVDSNKYNYIIQNTSNNYDIGDELIHTSKNKIYIILNKFVLLDEVKLQIIDSEYINNPDLILFSSKVEIIPVNKKKYVLKKKYPLSFFNKYYNQDINKNVTFIYANNNKYYLLNNLCYYRDSDPFGLNIDTNFNLLDLDYYIIYFLFYNLILFNKINSIQYKNCIKNYCLVGLSDINLYFYYHYFLQNSNEYKYFKYIKKYYDNILYFYIVNSYITNDINISDVNIKDLNLLNLYKANKLQKEDIFDKLKSKIETKLIEKLKTYLNLTKMTGGADPPTINITTPITYDKKEDKKEDKEKLSNVELIEKSPFSYFIHIELDLYPGELAEKESSGKIPLLQGLHLSCNSTKENIKKNIADIRHVPYKQKSYTPEELLLMNPTFPVNKFVPNYIKILDKKEAKQEPKEIKEEVKEEPKEEELKKGGGKEQIPNPYTKYPSFLNEYLNR